MTARVHAIIPYNNEPEDRLRDTFLSAIDAGCCDVHTWRSGVTLPGNINRAAEHAIAGGATHLCWVSTGDTLDMDRLKHGVPYERGQCCLVYVESRRDVYPDFTVEWQASMYKDNTICGTGTIVPVHVWLAVGGFDEALTYCSDWDWALKVQHQFGWELVPEVLARANEYPDGLTKTADPVARSRDRATVAKRAYQLRKYGTRWW